MKYENMPQVLKTQKLVENLGFLKEKLQDSIAQRSKITEESEAIVLYETISSEINELIDLHIDELIYSLNEL